MGSIVAAHGIAEKGRYLLQKRDWSWVCSCYETEITLLSHEAFISPRDYHLITQMVCWRLR
jgi:hypothetical protein